MTMRRTSVALLLAGVALCAFAGPAWSQEEAPKPQTICPIEGGKINKDIYADAACARIYACCAGCLEKIKADPQAAVQKIVDNGEQPECRPVICAKCGEIKGAGKCCAPDAKKCPKCGLNKKSIGCCKDLKPAEGEKDIVICPKCGEAKGSENCCNKDAAKCKKCGLIKGSPGCCKLGKACPLAAGGKKGAKQ